MVCSYIIQSLFKFSGCTYKENKSKARAQALFCLVSFSPIQCYQVGTVRGDFKPWI